MHDYSTARALKFTTLHSLIDGLYTYDTSQYSKLKKHEGQYAYFNYIKKVQRATHDVFYKPLPGRLNSIASMIEPSSFSRSSETCIVLNNNSLLGHVTVLRSMGHLLQNYSQNGSIKIVALLKGSNDQEAKWKKALSDAGLQVLDLSQSNMHDRFIELDSMLKPRQYIWWGWPPGQWIGPLLAGNAVHRSVSFKYDFPAARGFLSHHIGYGEQYASHISDDCKIFGFSQQFSPDLIPTFSQRKKQISIKNRSIVDKPLVSKGIIHVGTLGRSEKIAQKPFLETVKDIMLSDTRVIFHWTGREEPKSITEYFKKFGLSQRICFHGWVQPYEYLNQLDLYLDTFPFGTGETFVLAGLMGIPLVAMNSPFEANFTNLMNTSNDSVKFTCMTPKEYLLKVNNLLNSIEKYPPQFLSSFFEELFTPESLTCSKQTAMFSKQLDL